VAFSVAALIGGLFVVARLQGVTDLGPWGVFAGYVSLILAVGGVSLFSLGTSFNRLVALVHHRPIRQANLVGSVLGPAPERHFGWVGFVLVLVGVMMGIASLVLGRNVWLLGSALFTLVGGQLMLFRMLIRVVDTLDEREDRIGADLERSNRAVATVHVGQPALTGSRVN
jgi:hypothetical protein